MSRTAHRTAAALAIALTTAAVSACGGGGVDTTDLVGCKPAAGALILGISVHRNAPAPGVPQSLGCLIRATALNGMPISVLGIDGTPQVHPQLRNHTFQMRTGNAAAAEQDADRALATVIAAVSSLEADSDGSDVVAALGLVQDLAQSGGTPSATAVLLDPMLPDSGPLRLTEPGWATADPVEVADHLTEIGQLPETKGLHYHLVGVGYTAPPQEDLTAAMRDSVTDIWTEILRRGGAAEVVEQPEPRQGDGPDTSFTTATVPVSVPAQRSLCDGAVQVFGATSPLAFKSDLDVLRDQAAASAALREVASWLGADPARRANVVGTTANVGEMAGQVELSRRRATTVTRLLVGFGVEESQLRADGVGSAFPEYVPDADDPAARQANRTVRITLSGPSAGC